MGLLMMDYESTLLVKQEAFVYKIPPCSGRGHRAANWDVNNPVWTGRVKIVTLGDKCIVKLEDRNNGELFAKCDVDSYPSAQLEQVMDSSRYFVLRISDDSGRHAVIGLGFQDRGDAFDFTAGILDHFRWLKNSQSAEAAAAAFRNEEVPQQDLSLKGSIHIEIGGKKGDSSLGSARAVNTTPLQPGGALLPPPPSSNVRRQPNPSPNSPFPSHTPPLATPASNNPWGDFVSAPSVNGNNNTSTGSDWVQF